MKKIFNLMITGSIVLFFMTLISCENDETVTTTDSVIEDTNAKTATLATTSTINYYSAPTIGTYTPNSSSSITLPGTSGCGSFTGGAIKARVKSQSGSSFVIEIRKQNNTTFSISGIAYVKVGSVCGTIAQPNTQGISYSSGANSIEISVNATFTQGVVHFYPVIVSSSGGTRYFAEPIMIYTSPMYNIKSSYIIRETLGTVNGAIVKASNSNLLNSALNSLDVQCTEFCCRYYNQVYSKNIINPGTTNGGNAKDWYNTASIKGLQQISNGTTPRVGDILCMEGGGGNGHVAIIIEVGTSLIKISQQNAGIPPTNASNYNTHWQHAIGGGLSYNSSTKVITPPNGYTIEGLLRL